MPKSAFNCKSGKDRTGMLDAEVKHLATTVALGGRVPVPDHEPDSREMGNRLDMALNSGNHEMQQLNTGYMGYKLKGVDSVYDAMGGKKVKKPVMGQSSKTSE